MKIPSFSLIIFFIIRQGITAGESFDLKSYKPIKLENIARETSIQNKSHEHASGISTYDNLYRIEFSFKNKSKPNSLSINNQKLLDYYIQLKMLNFEYSKLFDREIKFKHEKHFFTLFIPSSLLFSKTDLLEQNSVKLYIKHGINTPGDNENYLFAHAINSTHINEHDRYDKFFLEGLEKNKNKQFAEAIELWNKPLELNPTNIETIYNRGNSKMHLNDYTAAIIDYDYRIAKDKYYLAYMNRGLCKNHLNLKKEALLDFNEAIKMNPTFYDSYYNKAIVEFELNLVKEAILNFESSLKYNKNNSDAYYYLGKIFKIKGDYKKAIENFTRAIRLNPSDLEAMVFRGVCLIKIGKRKDGCLDLENAKKQGYDTKVCEKP